MNKEKRMQFWRFWRSKNELINDAVNWTPAHARVSVNRRCSVKDLPGGRDSERDSRDFVLSAWLDYAWSQSFGRKSLHPFKLIVNLSGSFNEFWDLKKKKIFRKRGSRGLNEKEKKVFFLLLSRWGFRRAILCHQESMLMNWKSTRKLRGQ